MAIFVEHGSCELINELPGAPPAVGERVLVRDMDGGGPLAFRVVEVHGDEVRVELDGEGA